MSTADETPPTFRGRLLAGVLLAVAVGAFAVTALLGIAALTTGPDVYLEGHEKPTFVALALVQLGVIGYAIWGLSEFVRGRPGPFWSTALAYVVAGIAFPYLYLLAVRWFSGG